MGAKVTTTAISGFNSSPPADDGSQTASNLVTWAKHKEKLADPIKTAFESLNTKLVAYADFAVRRITSSDSLVAGDHMRTVEIGPSVSTIVTVTLADAATMTNIYRVYIKNSGTKACTIGRATSGDTIDGIAQNISIPPGAAFLLTTNNAANGYLLAGAYDESEPDIVQGRLTLTSGTAVTESVVAASTIYFTPYKGNKVALFDGTRWRRYSFTEVSLAAPSVSNTVHDIFLYDNAGTLTLDATAWTNDTTRATALTTQDGVYVKSGATSRRYIGTVRTTGTPGQVEDSRAKRFVWNYYNRVRRQMIAVEGTDNWNYTTATWRQANAGAANQLDFVVGVAEDVVEAMVLTHSSNSTASVTRAGGIGVDSTSANSAQLLGAGRDSADILTNHTSHYKGIPGVGRHYLAWLEYSDAAGTTTWYGDFGHVAIQSGIQGALLG